MSSPDAAHPAIVLVGPMGAGKTSIGRRVAKALALPFRDTDSEIVREHGPIPEIFERLGEPAFRAIEHDAVSRVLRQGGIVAVGGGAPMHPDTRAALVDVPVVLLTVTERVIAARIRGQKRPLLNRADRDPVAEWVRIRDERMPVYQQIASVTFDTSSGPMQGVVDRIVGWARSEGIVPGNEEDQGE